MATTNQRVLVIGAGAAGCAAAILLRRGGLDVDMIEQKASPSASGSGITLQGNALRVLDEVGLLPAVLSHGFASDMLGLRKPNGELIAVFPDFKTGGPNFPAIVGMKRQDFAEVLVDGATANGATIRFATTATTLESDASGVDVGFSDGSAGRYDLVIGADGVNSWTRRVLGIDVQPVPVGMGIFRIFCHRPESIVHTDLVYGGACYIAGYCPTGPNSMYAYLVEDAQDRTGLSPEQTLATVRDLAANYHGAWDEIRESLVDAAQIHYTWFESHIVPRPWNRGRVVLIGDAAHSCPPTLAQGGAMALEDASVLSELVLRGGAIDDAIFEEFMDRRFDRAYLVIENSLKLTNWLLAHDLEADVPGLMAATSMVLAERP